MSLSPASWALGRQRRHRRATPEGLPVARERTVRAVITILYVSWRTTVVLARWTARNWPLVRHQLAVAARATARTMRLVAVGVARWLSAHHRLLGRAGRRLSMVVVTA